MCCRRGVVRVGGKGEGWTSLELAVGREVWVLVVQADDDAERDEAVVHVVFETATIGG